MGRDCGEDQFQHQQLGPTHQGSINFDIGIYLRKTQGKEVVCFQLAFAGNGADRDSVGPEVKFEANS